MDAVLEQWYSKNLDEDIQKKRIDFLDNFELDLAKKLADKVLIGFTRHVPGSDANVSFLVSHYVDRLLQRKAEPAPYFVYSFCIQLYLMSQAPIFTPLEKNLLLKLIKRCSIYVNSYTIPQPEKQADRFQFDECQIEEMKNWTKRQYTIHTKGDTTSPLYEFKTNLPSYDYRADHEAIMKLALKEGKDILSDPKTIAMLAEIKKKNDIDPSREYGFVGYHDGKIHRNTKKDLRPIEGKNVLSLKSDYSGGENTIFHTHPDGTALSLNNYSSEGDIVHSYEADKKVFAINKNGDICASLCRQYKRLPQIIGVQKAMSISIKKYIFFALFLAGTVCSYATGQMLDLSIGIMEDYINIGANGGFLPNIYFKKKLDQNGFRYVLRQKENTDLFDEIIEDIKSIRQHIIKPDSNEIYFVAEPDEDAVNFSMKMESFAPLVHRIENMGIVVKYFISSWSGESLIPGKPSFKNPKAEIESIVNESNP